VRLTAEQRDTLINAFLGAIAVVFGGVIAVWVFVALIVGSIDLARWLEGMT
jgi:hypothetical protein